MLIFDHEPKSHWLHDDFEQLLIWADENDISDICLEPRTPIGARIHGMWTRVTNRPLNSEEILGLLDSTSRTQTASARVKGGDCIDYAFEIKKNRFERLRFRANGTACKDGWGSGATVVIRSISALPPKLEDLHIEPELMDSVFPNNGLVLVTGVMGTGKSTLLAAILRYIAENNHKNIITYEEPIEFDLMAIPHKTGPVAQSEIPTHVKDWRITPKNAARRAADVVLVGESRDPETLKGILELTEMGVAAYTTVHTRNVYETPTRIINAFAAEQQRQIASTMISSLRVIIQQRLLPKADGAGRVAVREYIVLTPDHREMLLMTPVAQLVTVLRKIVETDGQLLLTSVKEEFDKGAINSDSYHQIRTEIEKDDKNLSKN